MVVKVFISGISGNKEVKKRQQRVLMILDSRNIKYEVIDIAEPCNEEHKDFMQTKSTSLGSTIGDPNPKYPLPPQIFSDDEYCGDYDQFDLSNEIDEMEKFLKMAPDDSATAVSSAEIKLGNGEVKESKEENGTAEAERDEKPADDKGEGETEKEETKDGADNSKSEEDAENEREKSVEKKDDAEATKEEASEENGAGDEKAEVEDSKEENGEATNETKDEEKDGEAEEDEEDEE